MTREAPQGRETEVVAGPVVGYRRWRVTDDGRLAPPFYQPRYIDQGAWLDGRATARCHGRRGLCGNAYGCTCGLHAYNRPDHLPHWAPGATVTGAIVAWGKIVQHETGFRAEYARPIAFAEPAHHHGCTTEAVAGLYGGSTGWACCVMDPRLPVRMGDRYDVPVLAMDELVVYAGWFGDTLITPPAVV